MRRKRRRRTYHGFLTAKARRRIVEGMKVIMGGLLYRVIKVRSPYDWSQVKGARYG